MLMLQINMELRISEQNRYRSSVTPHSSQNPVNLQVLTFETPNEC